MSTCPLIATSGHVYIGERVQEARIGRAGTASEARVGSSGVTSGLGAITVASVTGSGTSQRGTPYAATEQPQVQDILNYGNLSYRSSMCGQRNNLSNKTSLSDSYRFCSSPGSPPHPMNGLLNTTIQGNTITLAGILEQQKRLSDSIIVLQQKLKEEDLLKEIGTIFGNTVNRMPSQTMDAKCKRSDEVLKKSAKLLQQLSEQDESRVSNEGSDSDVRTAKEEVLFRQCGSSNRSPQLPEWSEKTYRNSSQALNLDEMKIDIMQLKAQVGSGCWLGNPKGEKVWVPGGDPKNVLAAEVVSDGPAKLALALLNVIFTEKAAIAHQHHPDSSSIPTSLVGFTEPQKQTQKQESIAKADDDADGCTVVAGDLQDEASDDGAPAYVAN
ncbi:hypothetical protein EMCRGX_G024501 [Ephydatia muelleri]